MEGEQKLVVKNENILFLYIFYLKYCLHQTFRQSKMGRNFLYLGVFTFVSMQNQILQIMI